jgi:hypothetical protein
MNFYSIMFTKLEKKQTQKTIMQKSFLHKIICLMQNKSKIAQKMLKFYEIEQQNNIIDFNIIM